MSPRIELAASGSRLARVVDGIVHSFVEMPPGVALSDLLPPDDLPAYVAAPAEAVEGWRYNGATFAEPLPQAPSPVLPRSTSGLSFLEFMDLFTEAEQLAIAGAAMTDVAVKLWYDRAVGAQFIDVGDERLASGLQAFVTAGLLTSGRRNRVLKGLPPA